MSDNNVAKKSKRVLAKGNPEALQLLLRKSKAGRPTKMTPAVLDKLRSAFAMGCTDLEACLYAEIDKQTLYTYQDSHPEFLDQKELLKESPILASRAKVVSEVSSNLQAAQWYLERKRKGEFATRTDVTSGDEPVNFVVTRQAAVEGEVVEHKAIEKGPSD